VFNFFLGTSKNDLSLSILSVSAKISLCHYLLSSFIVFFEIYILLSYNDNLYLLLTILNKINITFWSEIHITKFICKLLMSGSFMITMSTYKSIDEPCFIASISGPLRRHLLTTLFFHTSLDLLKNLFKIMILHL